MTIGLQSDCILLGNFGGSMRAANELHSESGGFSPLFIIYFIFLFLFILCGLRKSCPNKISEHKRGGTESFTRS